MVMDSLKSTSGDAVKWYSITGSRDIPRAAGLAP